jgi:hypothetical protein
VDGKFPYGGPMGCPFDRHIVAQEHFFTPCMKVIHLIMKNVKQKVTDYRKTSYEVVLN